MRAPRQHANGYNWDPPDKEWLEYQYVTLDKSARTIAEEFGVGGLATVQDWLLIAGIPTRPLGRKPDGVSSKAVRRRNWKRLKASRRHRKCEWCGQGYEGSYSIVVHHRDHDRDNMELTNLQILCFRCHRLETALWYVVKEGKVEVETRADGLKLTFPYLRDK